MDPELKEILAYQTKLLEQIILTIDETRHRSASKQKEVLSNLSTMILNNPAINNNPQAKEFMSGIAGSLKSFTGSDS
jgi:hypothetical protein